MSSIRMLGAVLAGAIVLPSLVGCADVADEAGSAGASGGKADSIGGPGQVVVARAGAFSAYSMWKPAYLHYGFTDQASPGWSSAGTIEIEYDADKRSLPVVVELGQADGAYLGFVIESVRPTYRTSWSEDMFLEVAAPAGTLVRMPLSNGAPYPFSPECYSIGVQNESATGPWSGYDGILTNILVGYTPSSLDDYQANNDVAWFGLDGNPGLAGQLRPRREHDGGYKGAYFMLDEYAWVPEGMNLVFKLELDKYSGVCAWGDDGRLTERTATQTYFRDLSE